MTKMDIKKLNKLIDNIVFTDEMIDKINKHTAEMEAKFVAEAKAKTPSCLGMVSSDIRPLSSFNLHFFLFLV